MWTWERLLPKDKGANFGAPGENRLEWVYKDGHTYLAPAADLSTKITGIREMGAGFQSIRHNLLWSKSR